MSDITKHEYEGELISFDFRSQNKMINATQMARPFKKNLADFIRINNTKRFVTALEARYGNSHNGERAVLEVIQGGTPEKQGTWMDELLAIKFAG